MFSITKNIKKGGSLFVEKITSTLIFLFLILGSTYVGSYTYAGNEWVGLIMLWFYMKLVVRGILIFQEKR